MSRARVGDNRSTGTKETWCCCSGGWPGRAPPTLHERLEALEPRLRAVESGRLIVVLGGKVMRLNDHLATRIVEQNVHLDDLARSVNRDPWPISPEAAALTISLGTEIARRRSGSTVIRALYRHGFANHAVPVL